MRPGSKGGKYKLLVDSGTLLFASGTTLWWIAAEAVPELALVDADVHTRALRGLSFPVTCSPVT